MRGPRIVTDQLDALDTTSIKEVGRTGAVSRLWVKNQTSPRQPKTAHPRFCSQHVVWLDTPQAGHRRASSDGANSSLQYGQRIAGFVPETTLSRERRKENIPDILTAACHRFNRAASHARWFAV